MFARTLTIAALAAALGLSACPAEPTHPWGIVANGTRLNGIALEAVTLDSIRMQEAGGGRRGLDGLPRQPPPAVSI